MRSCETGERKLKMLILKEYCNFKPVNTSSAQDKDFDLTEGINDYGVKEGTLMVEIEGIHAYPFSTRNYTRYMPQALKASEKYWTTPYLKPLIKHHNDQDGEIIGRVYNAEYVDKTSVEGVGGLIFTISVPDKKAAEEVENRILETVSIGVSTNDVRCSVCGSKIYDSQEGCPEGHVRGAAYDGERCYWDIYSIDPKELSYVIVPSDIYAKNRKVFKAGSNDNIGSLKLVASANNLDTKDKIDFKENISTDGGINLDMDLEQQLAEANEKLANLQAELDKANEAMAELEAVKAEKAALEEKLQEVKDLLENKESALEEKTAAIETYEEDIATVRQEKEAAEDIALKAQESLRAFVEQGVNHFRKLLGKTELEESVLKARSLDSLQDGYNDLKEELSTGVVKEEIKLEEQQIMNPVAPKNTTPQKTIPNKEYQAVNLEEGLQKLFDLALK